MQCIVQWSLSFYSGMKLVMILFICFRVLVQLQHFPFSFLSSRWWANLGKTPGWTRKLSLLFRLICGGRIHLRGLRKGLCSKPNLPWVDLEVYTQHKLSIKKPSGNHLLQITSSNPALLIPLVPFLFFLFLCLLLTRRIKDVINFH